MAFTPQLVLEPKRRQHTLRRLRFVTLSGQQPRPSTRQHCPRRRRSDGESAPEVIVQQLVRKRWKFVGSSAIRIAFFMDPSTNLDDFIGADEQDAIQRTCDFAERCGIIECHTSTRAEFKAALFDFADEKRGWLPSDRLEYRATKPRAFWSSFKSRYPLLGDLANFVFSIPTSSTASERAWSIFNLIQSKRRNRLAPEKVESLAYIYINSSVMATSRVDVVRAQPHPECYEDDEIEWWFTLVCI